MLNDLGFKKNVSELDDFDIKCFTIIHNETIELEKLKLKTETANGQ